MSHLDHLYHLGYTAEGDTVNPIYHTKVNERKQRFRLRANDHLATRGVIAYKKETDSMGLSLNVSVGDNPSQSNEFTDEELITIVEDAIRRRLETLAEETSGKSKALGRALTGLQQAGHNLYLMRREEEMLTACKSAKKEL